MAQSEHQPLLLPNTPLAIAWSLCFSLLMIGYFSSALFSLCFLSASQQVLNTISATVVLFVVCTIDTALSVNTGIIRNGKLVRSRDHNLRRYFRSMLFATDLVLSVILVVRIALAATDEQSYSITISILDLGVCLKFYNLTRYEKSLKYYNLGRWFLLVYQFLKYLILLAFLCHTMGCLFYLIDVLMIDAQWYDQADYWIVSNSAYPGLLSQPVSIQYLYSFYFSLVTLSSVAYGDITPLNPTETSFVISMLAFLLLFYAYIFTQIYQVVNTFNRDVEHLQESTQKLVHFLTKCRISPGLRARIVSEYDYLERRKTRKNKDLFINDISSKLARQYNAVPLKLNQQQFIPRFIHLIGLDLVVFYELLEEKTMLPTQQFQPVHLDDWAFDFRMFYVGRQKVYRQLSTGSSSIREKAEVNTWLGLESFMTGQYDPNEKYSCTSPYQIIYLNSNKFKQCLRGHFEAKQKYHEHSHRLILGITFSSSNRCLICWQDYHSSLRCRAYRTSNHQNSENSKKGSTEIQTYGFVHRHRYKRPAIRSSKFIAPNQISISRESVSCQTDLVPNNQSSSLPGRSRRMLIFQAVWDWNHYMREFNTAIYNCSPSQYASNR